VGVRAEAEVLHGLARVLRATEKDGVGASRGAEGELVESEALTAGLGDAGAGGGGEAEGADAHLRQLEEADIVGDAGDGGDGLALVGLGGGGLEDGTGDLGERDPGGVLLVVCFLRDSGDFGYIAYGARLVLLWRRRRRTVWLNLESVRRANCDHIFPISPCSHCIPCFPPIARLHIRRSRACAE